MSEVSVKAIDPNGKALEGIHFTSGKGQSLPTATSGVTVLEVPSLAAGELIGVELPSSFSEEWLLVDSAVYAPKNPAEGPVEVVLMRRSDLRELAREARDAFIEHRWRVDPISAEQRREILAEFALQYGLSKEQLSAAILNFSETRDLTDQGIAAYLSGEYKHAEASLLKAANLQESEDLETLRYLGASHYAQEDYVAAVESFRKALSLQGDDLPLLGWLARSLCKEKLWEEMESVERRFLELSLLQYGETAPKSATAMRNLALLLQTMDRWDEAELLMRRALAIVEASYDENHLRVVRTLNDLAQLLRDMNRLDEAEPLMRRALAIGEAIYDENDARVAGYLNNLATILQATNRLDEAEPLMRRALAISEASYGEDDTRVGSFLNNLATLLWDMNRLDEAEPLMRRALAIDETSFGENHTRVAVRLNNLAQLLQATNRLDEAEPLMRRTLAIDEAIYGENHSEVATDLNNLALILQDMGRLDEAEPLMRRALAIDEAVLGDDHPTTQSTREDLAALLNDTASQRKPGGWTKQMLPLAALGFLITAAARLVWRER